MSSPVQPGNSYAQSGQALESWELVNLFGRLEFWKWTRSWKKAAMCTALMQMVFHDTWTDVMREMERNSLDSKHSPIFLMDLRISCGGGFHSLEYSFLYFF